MAKDGDILDETEWYIKEHVSTTTARPYAHVNYFVKEREELVYADKRAPAAFRATSPNLTAARRALNFWGQFIAVEFLKKLYAEWENEMVWGFRHSVETTHGYYPKLLLGDISQRGGGPILIKDGKTAHITHQHGSQIDIYYFTMTGENKTIIYDPGKSDEANNWNRDLNTRLLRALFRAGGQRVLTECEPFFAMDEFKDLVAQGKIVKKPPHRDHFHVEFGY